MKGIDAFKIKQLLVNNNMSIKELAKETPVNYSYLLEILNHKKEPSIMLVLKIAKALNVEIEQISNISSEEEVR
jgi:transcriptional regulator with XRE-family HTH domain